MTPFRTNNRVTSAYGYRQYYQGGKLVKGFHRGIDVVPCVINQTLTESDWQVREVTGGTVISIKYDTARGKYVDVRTSPTAFERYQHLNSVSVNVGDTLAQGQVLGVAGTTGDVTGRHLHFAVFVNGSAETNSVNPQEWLGLPNIVGSYEGNNTLDGTGADSTLTPVSAKQLRVIATNCEYFYALDINAVKGFLPYGGIYPIIAIAGADTVIIDRGKRYHGPWCSIQINNEIVYVLALTDRTIIEQGTGEPNTRADAYAMYGFDANWKEENLAIEDCANAAFVISRTDMQDEWDAEQIRKFTQLTGTVTSTGRYFGIQFVSHARTQDELQEECTKFAKIIMPFTPYVTAGVWLHLQSLAFAWDKQEQIANKQEYQNLCIFFTKFMNQLGFTLLGVYADKKTADLYIDDVFLQTSGLKFWLSQFDTMAPARVCEMWQYEKDTGLAIYGLVDDVNKNLMFMRLPAQQEQDITGTPLAQDTSTIKKSTYSFAETPSEKPAPSDVSVQEEFHPESFTDVSVQENLTQVTDAPQTINNTYADFAKQEDFYPESFTNVSAQENLTQVTDAPQSPDNAHYDSAIQEEPYPDKHTDFSPHENIPQSTDMPLTPPHTNADFATQEKLSPNASIDFETPQKAHNPKKSTLSMIENALFTKKTRTAKPAKNEYTQDFDTLGNSFYPIIDEENPYPHSNASLQNSPQNTVKNTQKITATNNNGNATAKTCLEDFGALGSTFYTIIDEETGEKVEKHPFFQLDFLP